MIGHGGLLQVFSPTAVERRNQGTSLAIRPKIVARHVNASASLG